MNPEPLAASAGEWGATPGRVARSLFFHFTVWTCTVLLGTLCIFGSIFFPKRAVVQLGALWSWLILKAAGVRLEVRGLEHLSRGCEVLAGNHASNFDIYALLLALRPWYFRFVVKKELRYIPVFGWALWASGFPFVDRGSSPKALKVMEKLRARMRRTAMKVVLFPEGTRNRDLGLRRFKKGAVVLALDLGVPLVPFVVNGARRVQARHKFLVRPGTVRLTFLEPIPTEGLTYQAREKLLSTLRERIYERLDDDEK